uniref:Gag1-like clamp domain-containing protein n=1 Tax=Davidia involucrata TaxID=16924 RepID=A0A5B7A2M0_DAVIN
MMVLYGSFTSWISDCLACMGSCLGRCAKPSPIIAVDEPSKGLRIQGRTVKKPSVSEDFWSTSTCEMDNSAVQSQRSISSISISNQSLSHCSGTGSTSNPSEFINHGLLLWNQTRLQWIGSKRSENQGKVRALGLRSLPCLFNVFFERFKSWSSLLVIRCEQNRGTHLTVV